ncbi:hypothetical protein NBRC111893_596 [Lentilactobacillus kosonis]|uniref:Uncharacterized protein n=1 Tax=Lentilactobacillus kosonis TaxID=2810561 RepID=A0A401FJ80_9LACO|nr:hypothetical protein NBRC111893_596 [Lentilactobacillus kosonis]
MIIGLTSFKTAENFTSKGRYSKNPLEQSPNIGKEHLLFQSESF